MVEIIFWMTTGTECKYIIQNVFETSCPVASVAPRYAAFRHADRHYGQSEKHEIFHLLWPRSVEGRIKVIIPTLRKSSGHRSLSRIPVPVISRRNHACAIVLDGSSDSISVCDRFALVRVWIKKLLIFTYLSDMHTIMFSSVQILVSNGSCLPNLNILDTTQDPIHRNSAQYGPQQTLLHYCMDALNRI